MGASCDWTRERFTLDEGLSRAVRRGIRIAFYEKGLIYRGPRLVNWSPNLKAAVSDLEVEHSQEPGTLYYFKYRLADNPEEYLPVATTRRKPSWATQPWRFTRWTNATSITWGAKRWCPCWSAKFPSSRTSTWTRIWQRRVKITPAHDPNDYDIAQRHNLEVINILNRDVTINENGGQYQGLGREVCRKQIWQDMKERGLVIKEEPYMLNVPRSQRGDEIIEPMISEQWFVKIEPLAKEAIAAVKDGRIRIVPQYTLPRCISTGWRTSRIGASAASFGGGTVSGVVLRRLRQDDRTARRPQCLPALRQQER